MRLIERILLDMDGVLTDFLGGACKFHQRRYDGHPHNPGSQVEQKPWDIEPIFGMTPEELWGPLGFEFWRDLSPLPWCFDVVDRLTKRFGVENICILTSPIKTDGCIDGKMAWIRTHLPQFRRQFLIGPAKQFAASPFHCLVDDHPGNIDAFARASGHIFLFPAPWNRKFKEEPLKALDGWLASV